MVRWWYDLSVGCTVMASGMDDKVKQIQSSIDTLSEVVHKIDKDVAVHNVALEEHISRGDIFNAELLKMNEILHANTESLKEHMSRTELLESLVCKIDERLAPIEIERIEKAAVCRWRQDKIMWVLKVVGALAALGGAGALVKMLIVKLLAP